MSTFAVMSLVEGQAIADAQLFGKGLNLVEIIGFVRKIRAAFTKLGLTPEEIREIIEEVRELIDTGFTVDGALRLLALIMDSLGNNEVGALTAGNEGVALDVMAMTVVEPSAIDPGTLALLFQLANILLPILKNSAKLLRDRIKERREKREVPAPSPDMPEVQPPTS